MTELAEGSFKELNGKRIIAADPRINQGPKCNNLQQFVFEVKLEKFEKENFGQINLQSGFNHRSYN